MPSPAESKTQADHIIAAIEELRGSRVIVYWLTDMARISEAAVVPLHDQLTTLGTQEKLDLVLFTRGGDTEVPWRIVSLIREYCRRFSVIVPYRCYSAGTLVAMGADEIIMTPLSVLGPIDPSRSHPLLPRRQGAAEAEPISVQDMRHAMQFIREAAGQGLKVGGSPEATAQIFAALFEKIHPLAIGAIEQSYALAKIIGTQCLSTHMDEKSQGKQIKRIVDKLCDDYKSHHYQIGRREARSIGLKAVDAPPTLETAITNLLKFYLARPTLASQPGQPPQQGQLVQGHIAWLDSRALHLVVVANYQIQADGQPKHIEDYWRTY